MIGAFEYGAKIYYGDDRVDFLIQGIMSFFPINYTMGEALKVLRYGMPLILQAALLMMDNSFDALGAKKDNPTELLSKICEKQNDLCKKGIKIY